MARDPISYGTQIGQGMAQVFDTSKLASWIFEQEKQKEKNLLDTIVDLDTSNVWSRDMNMYNEKWGTYRDYVKKNYKALKNPSKNMDVWAEKKRLEQELTSFVASSKQARAQYVEASKLLLEKDKYEDIYETDVDQDRVNELMATINPTTEELYTEQEAIEASTSQTGLTALSSYRTRAGDFTTPISSLLKQRPKDISVLQKRLHDDLTNSVVERSVVETRDASGITTKKDVKKVDVASWDAGVTSFYNTSIDYKTRMDELYKQEVEERGEGFTMDVIVDDDGTIEQVPINNALEYTIALERAYVPKGSELNSVKQANKNNFSVNLDLGAGADHTFSSPSTVESGDIHTNVFEGENYESIDVVYSGGRGSQVSRTIDGTYGGIIAESGELQEGAVDVTLLGYVKKGNDYYMNVATKRSDVELNKKKQELKAEKDKSYAPENTGRDNWSIIEQGGGMVDNTRIPELEAEIAELEGRIGTEKIILLPLSEEKNRNLLNTTFGNNFTMDMLKEKFGDTGEGEEESVTFN